MGLLEKARYFRMGFRDKAGYWLDKWGMLPMDKPVEKNDFSDEPAPVLEPEVNIDLTHAQTTLDKKIHDVNTLFEIGKELNSSLDIDELLEIILLTCMGQMGVDHIAVLIKNQDFISIRGQRGLDDVDIHSIAIPVENEFISSMETTELPVTLDELNVQPGGSEVVNIFTRLHSEIIVPLIAKGNLNGFIAIGKKMSRTPYNQEDKDFLSMLASMAAIAVDNASLYSNLKTANEELAQNFKEFSTLYEISKIINSSDELDEVLKLALETMSTGFGVECASLCLYDEKGNMHIQQSIGLSEETISSFVITPENATFSLLMETGEPEILEDFKTLEDVYPLFSEADMNHIDMFLSIPLTGSEKKLGLLNIHKINRSEEETINTEKDLKLFALFASQIAPPILTTQMLKSGVLNHLDLFIPLVEKLEKEIELARDFDVPLNLILLKIQGAPSYPEEEEAMNELTGIFKNILAEGQSVYRYGRNRMLLIMPNLSQDETFSTMSSIMSEIRVKKEWATLEFSTVNFPADGETARELLYKVE